MPTYSQANRPLAITTPLGKDVLLLTGFHGHEAISELFSFQLDLRAEVKSDIKFEKILGQSVTVQLVLANKEKRYFNGLINRFGEGARDDTFVYYGATVVPKLWLLTKRVRSRVFQQLSVPDILHQVLTGLDVGYEISGTYHPRDYCVQYGESDFEFASRLMEEEGIYYFFKHTDGRHQLVLTDAATQHPTVAGQSSVIYDVVSGGQRSDLRITAWGKTQELRAGEYTLWDHCFELPGNHLEAKVKTVDSVAVGKVTHKLAVGGNDQLEVYHYPGGYAQRFDGVDKNGVVQAKELQQILPDGQRTARLRMEREESACIEVGGTSDCGQFSAGHKFTLERHFDADGSYLLTRVEHHAKLSGYRSGEPEAFEYDNKFRGIPVALPYRPPLLTPRPVIASIQTATVVGPKGEEIFCDKYGRVKVQFHWDREGKKDATSSCWLRVAQVWAGKGWGAFFWPRVGNEVVVAFEEGDPDQPVIVGSVYNAENMPAFGLPGHKQYGGIRSASVRGHASENFNAIVFDDAKGQEHLALHSERDMTLNAEMDKDFLAGRHKGEKVARANVFTVGALPGGGGSGGGPLDPIQMAWNGNPGLNSVVVFGENLQAAVGLNHQLTLGSNVQICMNPMGLLNAIKVMPPGAISMLGGGLGGNIQFTIGTNAAITYGHSINLTLGPPALNLGGGDEKAKVSDYILCGIIAGTILLFSIMYGALNDKTASADAAVVFNSTLYVLLGGLLNMELETKQADDAMEKARKEFFQTHKSLNETPTTLSVVIGEAVGAALVTAGLLVS
jgi:type VI secretion system secreted protein VgrG